MLICCCWILAGHPSRASAQEPARIDDRSASESLSFANRLLRDRRYDLAAEEYEKVLAGRPRPDESNDARFGLATARWSLGQYRAARAQFESFLAQAPDHPGAPTAWFRSGEAAYLLGDLPAARSALRAYTSKFPGHRHQDTAWTYLGELASRLGDQDDARSAYEKALSLAPSGRLADRVRYGLARTLAAQKDPAGARRRLDEILQAGSPEWSDKARLQRGLIALAAGDAAAARIDFEALERETPASPLVPEARLRDAEALDRLGLADEAETRLQAIAQSDGPLSLQASYNLADLLLRRKKPAEALAVCDAALARGGGSPASPLLMFRSAEAADAAGRPDDARDRYLKLAQDSPKDEWADDALLRGAELTLKKGDPAQARELAASLPRRFPASPLKSAARLVEGRAALDAKDTAAAIAILEPLAADPALDPKLAPSVRLALGLSYRAAGQPDRARTLLSAMSDAPPDAQYLLGVENFDAKQYDDAITGLEAYLAAKPTGELAADALGLIAQAHQAAGRDDEAATALEKLADAFPTSAALTSARLRLGEAALDAGRFDQVERLAAPVADTATDVGSRTRGLYLLGWSRLELGQPDEALARLDALIQGAPDDPLAADAALARARALADLGRTDEALAVYTQASDQYVAKRPRVAAMARLARGRLLARLGRHAEAADTLAAYLKDHPTPVEGGEPTESVLADLGWSCLEAGRDGEAEAAFNRLLKEFPDSPRTADARVALAERDQAAGRLDEAMRRIEPLLASGAKVDPTLLQSSLYRLGLIHAERRDWPAARLAFDRLVNDFPDGPLLAQARFWKAEAAFQAGDAEAAEPIFASLLAAAPSAPADPGDWRPTARLRHAECLVALGRWSDALAETDALVRDVPGFPARHELDYTRGRALQGLARFDEAREAYQNAIAANRPDEIAARAHLMRGESYFHQQKYSEALKEYLRVAYATDVVPSLHAAALLEAGQVAEKLQRWADAADFYRQVRAKHPDDPLAARAADRLAALSGRTP
jgi:TolA-binding protein